MTLSAYLIAGLCAFVRNDCPVSWSGVAPQVSAHCEHSRESQKYCCQLVIWTVDPVRTCVTEHCGAHPLGGEQLEDAAACAAARCWTVHCEHNTNSTQSTELSGTIAQKCKLQTQGMCFNMNALMRTLWWSSPQPQHMHACATQLCLTELTL
jgi:hypothetical protein